MFDMSTTLVDDKDIQYLYIKDGRLQSLHTNQLYTRQKLALSSIMG